MKEQKNKEVELCSEPITEGIRFFLICNSGKIIFNNWNEATASYETKAQWLLLKELLNNGEAESGDDFVFIPNETIFNLSNDDLRLLNLPDFCPYDIKIEPREKTLNQQDFNYSLSFCDFDDETIFADRTGCILKISPLRNYLLTKEQTALLYAIETFNGLPQEERGYTNSLLKFSEIKELSQKTGAILDRYLNSTEVVSPKKICLRLDRIGNILEISPEIESLSDDDNTEFQKKFDLYPQAQDDYAIQKPDNSRIRIVFNNEQKEALGEIKRKRRINRQEAEKIFELPQDYFDPEIVDLDSTFSERVKEIGFYKPRMYPFIFKYKSKWFPGISITKPDGIQKKIEIKSESDIKKIEQLIEKSRNENKDTIIWNDEEIPINDIGRHIPFLKQQTNNPTQPTEKKTSGGEPVLIISEHIDDTIFRVPAPDDEEFRHFYEASPNLKPEIEKIYPHQQEGIAWLQELYRKRHAGGLLADDMGLGKTLQVLAFLNWHDKYRKEKKEPKKPYLIIAPVTLLENWEIEYCKFFYPKMKLITLYGDNLKKYKTAFVSAHVPDIQGAELISKVREKRGCLDFKRLESADMILTTYETVRDFQVDLGLVDWAIIVIDEAQKIKTPGTLVTNAVKALKTDFRIACTGTPVENSLVDLWCITDFVIPGYMGSAKEFAKNYQHPLRHSSTNTRDIGEKVRQRIGIYFKRRLKKDILNDLPEKFIHRKEFPMPEVQLQRYLEEVKAIQEIGINKEHKKCVLQSIRELKNISDHPYVSNFINEHDIDTFINQSAKLIKTIEILEGIRNNGEKAVIFSEHKNTCRMLQQVISEKFALNKSDIYIVNGDMPGSKQREDAMKVSRQTAINKFEAKNGFNVIIMSPLAAGVGLNITKANHVIHYTRWWNPAKEEQATDRVYRIGQKLPDLPL